MTGMLAEKVAEARAGYWGHEAGQGDLDVRVVRNGDVSPEGGVSWDRCPVRAFSSAETVRCSLRPGDILITTSGECGKVAIVRQIPEGTYCASNFIRLVRPTSDVEPRFLYWWLTSSAAQKRMAPFIRGTTLKNLSFTSFIESAPFSAPSLAEQRRIADILDKADAIHRKRKQAIALTDELLRSAFLEIVGPGASGYSKWPVKPIESLAAAQPNAMRTGPFGSDLRHSEFVNEGVAVLGIDNAVQNRFAWGERRFISPEKYDRLRRYTVRPGDVIVTIMGTTGRSAVVPDDIPTAITTKHLATITLDHEQAEPEFLSQALFRHPEALRQIGAANRGAIMSGLNLGLIKALRLPVPPPERQRRFSEVVQKTRAMADRMVEEHLAEDLFGSLVSRAFSGRVVEAGSPC